MKPKRILITRDKLEYDKECTIWRPSAKPILVGDFWGATNPFGKWVAMSHEKFAAGFNFSIKPGSKVLYELHEVQK